MGTYCPIDQMMKPASLPPFTILPMNIWKNPAERFTLQQDLVIFPKPELKMPRQDASGYFNEAQNLVKTQNSDFPGLPASHPSSCSFFPLECTWLHLTI